MRTIYLPAVEKHITLATYVQSIKIAKAHPNETFKHGLTCWCSCTGAEIVQQFRHGIHDRINQAIPAILRGR